MDPNNPTTITLPAGQIHASVVIRAANTGSPFYSTPLKSELVATLGTWRDSVPLTLIDKDPNPTVTLSTSTPVVDEGQSIQLTMSHSAGTDKPIRVRLTVGNPNNRPLENIPSDYYEGGPGLYVPAGQTAPKSYTINTVNTDAMDGDHTITFIIARPTQKEQRQHPNRNTDFRLGDHAVTVTVRDVTPAVTPTVTVTNHTVDEPPSGESETLDFEVVLSKQINNQVTVDYRTEDSSAKAGSDYTATSGTLTFAPNETWRLVRGDVLDDGVGEDRETMRFWIENPTGGPVLTQFHWGLGVIYDKKPTFVAYDASAHESGNATETTMRFKVHLLNAAPGATTICSMRTPGRPSATE